LSQGRPMILKKGSQPLLKNDLRSLWAGDIFTELWKDTSRPKNWTAFFI
jgi:hypothetical protein